MLNRIYDISTIFRVWLRQSLILSFLPLHQHALDAAVGHEPQEGGDPYNPLAIHGLANARGMAMRYEPGGAGDVIFAPKNSCRLLLLLRQNQRYCRGLLDSLSLPRHGESSGELGSVMI